MQLYSSAMIPGNHQLTFAPVAVRTAKQKSLLGLAAPSCLTLAKVAA
jgi:hypothetical protein